jgi:hypothetical protein
MRAWRRRKVRVFPFVLTSPLPPPPNSKNAIRTSVPVLPCLGGQSTMKKKKKKKKV